MKNLFLGKGGLTLESKTVEIQGLNYHYLEFPNAGKPKLLLIHGIIVESHYWIKMIELIKSHYHIYALDLKGHGKTERGTSYASGYSPQAIARDIHEFQQKVIQEPFFLVGYSLGGQFSMAYASEYGNELKGLVIIDSAPSLPMRGIFTLLLADMVTPKVFKTLEDVSKFYSKTGIPELGEYMAEHAVTQREDGKFQLKFDKKNISPRTLMENMARNKYLWQTLHKIKAPFLMIKAGKSKIINQRMVYLMKRVAPQLQVIEVPEVGHEFVFTHPDKVAEPLNQFIRENVSGS
jgi:pimeloyl-ACP methyl ester carboxylesterase